MNSTPLEKYLFELTRSVVSEGSNKGYRSKSIHVTSLTAPCVRRTYYDLTRPKEAISYNSSAIFRVGQIIHEGIPLSKDNNEVSLAANIREMKPIETKDINPINFFDCVTGTADDILEFNNETVIVDKKTWSTVKRWEPKEASEDYINQLNLYKLLYFIKTGKEVKKGAIIYLDVATRLELIKVFEVELAPIEDIRKRVIEKLDMLKSSTVPNRSTSWRCDYCPWNTKEVCNPEADGTFKLKPKQ